LVFFVGFFNKIVFGGGGGKTLKTHQKFVYIDFCYVFTSQANIPGGWG